MELAIEATRAFKTANADVNQSDCALPDAQKPQNQENLTNYAYAKLRSTSHCTTDCSSDSITAKARELSSVG